MSDPLASWWVHSLTVERYLGKSPYGDSYAAPGTVTGFYSDADVYQAGQVVARGRFAFPSSVAYVPVQSRVTLPAGVFGTRPDGSPRVYNVVTSAVGDGGGQPTPDHQEIGVA